MFKKENIVVSFGGGTFELKDQKKVLSECIPLAKLENDTLINRINSKIGWKF